MTFETSDLSLAAFLVMKGFELKTAQKLNSGKFLFIIDDKNNEAKKVAMEYINSDFCKFDNNIRSIKKIIYTK
jgi:hypothetical protein